MLHLKKTHKDSTNLKNQLGQITLMVFLPILILIFLGIYILHYLSPSLISVFSQTTDTTAPVTIVRLLNTVRDNIFTCSANFDIICRDEPGGSGCNGISPKYCIDSTNTCIPDKYSSIPPTLTTQEGLGYIRYHSVDQAGNTGVIKSTSLIIDRTPPSMRLNSLPSTVRQYHKYSWTLIGVNDISGIKKVECYWDLQMIGSPIFTPNNGSTGYECSILIPPDASLTDHNVTAKVYDNAGWYKSDTVRVSVQPY